MKPYVDGLLSDYAKAGPKRVTVICPGFATDCLETLEEIDMQNREAFLSHGGEAFDYVPCLNSSDAQVDLYDRVVTRHTQGWPGLAGEDDSASRAESRQRALALGART
jgi:ferrochelatase